MKVTENKGVLVAEGHDSLCLAALMIPSKAQIVNALVDHSEELTKYQKHLATIFHCEDLAFHGYSIFEYENRFNPYARSLAEELRVDEFDEVAARILEYTKQQ